MESIILHLFLYANDIFNMVILNEGILAFSIGNIAVISP